MLICCVEGCTNKSHPTRYKGMCQKHYSATLPLKICTWNTCDLPVYQRSRLCVSHSNLKSRHQITEVKWFSILDAQNNNCRMCQTKLGDFTRSSVDHNRNCCPGHISCGNCVRGIIHQECNVIEGYVRALQIKVGVIDYYQNVVDYQNLPSYFFTEKGEVNHEIQEGNSSRQVR